MSHRSENKLRQWRLKAGRTVRDLAAEIGCTRVTWYSWEDGNNIPSAPFMQNIVNLTDGAVTPNDFYALPASGARRAA